jgi:putative SOS response-associated peptidase YedK
MRQHLSEFGIRPSVQRAICSLFVLFMTRRSAPQWKIDKVAFPVTIRVLIPENGFSQWGIGNQPDDWLIAAVGPGQYTTTPRNSLLGDGVEFHFRSLDDGSRFLDRFPQIVLADATMGVSYRSPAVPFGRREVEDVCNLYSMTRAQDAMRQLFARLDYDDRLGNLAPLPEVYPDYSAPILRNGSEGPEMVMARWGLPTPPQFLIGKKTDRGVTNVRNTASPHWRRWLGVPNRCLVPFTAFAEPVTGSGGNAWFEFEDDRPAFFAGLQVPGWKSVRKLKDGETTDDLFAFLTADPNAEVRKVHPKAMPVILTDPDDWRIWLTAPWTDAMRLQRPLPDQSLGSRSAS